MLKRLHVLLAFLLLALVLPSAALAEDEPKPGDKPPAAKPGDKPPAAKPGEDKPAPDPEEDTPEEPAPVPGEGEPDGEKDDGSKDAPEKGDPEKDAAGSSEKIRRPEPPVPAPAGMTYLQAGPVKIGTEQSFLSALLAGRPPEHQKFFRYETPYHTVFARPYFIGKYEITNAQYRVFLQDHEVIYDTASGSLANLDEISADLVDLSKDEQANAKQTVWLQFYRANKEALWKAFEAKMDKFIVKRHDKTVDEYATARKMRFEPLPRTLKLRFYSLRPPANWPDMSPPKGEEDHPVRFVSYNDVEKFAEWAGMHLPTEAEWEWAARGPNGPTFPWGNAFPPNALYANWGGKITNARYEPTTLPVATRDGANPDGAKKDTPLDGDGRSWCGCHHMVGNVAEWTSSWFQPYGPSRAPKHSFMGRWVKVIRGGGAGDGEMLVLRAACRNFIGGGPDAPPYPDNFFQWVGFRLASYMKSGRDQLGPIMRRANIAKKLPPEHMNEDRFIGAVTRNWVEPDATPENHVYIRGRSHAIVLIPHRTFLRDDGLQLMRSSWKRSTSFKRETGLRKRSETDDPFFTLAILHSDIPITPVQVRKPEDPKAEDGKKKKTTRRRGRAKAPETVAGTAAPGTYALGVWFGRLCLMTPSGEFVAFLPKPEGVDKKWSPFSIESLETTPESTLKVDSDLDWADFSIAMPVGGKTMKDDVHLVVKGRLLFEVGALDEAGVWLQEDPAAELTKTLRAKFEGEQGADGKDDEPRKDDEGAKGDESDKKKSPKKAKGDTKKTAAAGR